MFRLYKGFNKIGEFKDILQAKKEAPKEDGVYNLIGDNYSDSWQIIGGIVYD